MFFISSSSSDWPLACIANLDINTPGLAGHFLRASDERRQVICAYLAVRPTRCEGSAATGKLLMRASHREILRLAFGKVPHGLRGALSRSGGGAHAVTYYIHLHRILAASDATGLARVIGRMAELNEEKLTIAESLPGDLQRAEIIQLCPDAQTARDLVTIANLFEKIGLDRREFINALVRTTEESLTKVVKRWALHVPFPAHPLPATTAYHPITSGIGLRRAALVYRNCMRSYMAEALDGKCAFAEYIIEGQAILIQLERHDGMWTFSDCYAFRNRNVPPALSTAAQDYAGRHGVPPRRKRSRRNGDLAALHRLAGLGRSWW